MSPHLSTHFKLSQLLYPHTLSLPHLRSSNLCRYNPLNLIATNHLLHSPDPHIATTSPPVHGQPPPPLNHTFKNPQRYI
ncbi:hypothetical protein L6452_24640 [Arctium lappa]|uniref:Uncharacterized protein n=1 Tax=Arctium lappa TaxID=4217 RepID=A0ACB9A9Q3_ARCLA|nr:hypothetical protein L6452_24640 [Arctium lappa]